MTNVVKVILVIYRHGIVYGHAIKLTNSVDAQTVTHLFGDLADRLYTGAVQISIVLSCLNELVTLDVSFHLLARNDEVVVAAVNLVRPASACRVCQPHNGHLLVITS